MFLETEGGVLGRRTIVGSAQLPCSTLDQLESRGVFLVPSPLPSDALGLVRDNPGHWRESGVPARVLSSAPLELSSVRTVVYRLQTAFQEALDLYHLVSQDPASG